MQKRVNVSIEVSFEILIWTNKKRVSFYVLLRDIFTQPELFCLRRYQTLSGFRWFILSRVVGGS